MLSSCKIGHVASALGLSLLAASPTLAGELTIRDLAPSGSVFVAGIDDVEGFRAAFDRTGFKALWDDPKVKQWATGLLDEVLPDIVDGLDEMGIDAEELSWPSGGVGMAFELAPDSDDGSVLLIADFGASAGKMDTTLVQALERGHDQGEFELDDTKVNGVTIWTIESDDEEDDGDVDFDDLDAGDIGDMLEKVGGGEIASEMHYAHVGEYLVMCSNEDLIESVIDQIHTGRKGGIGDTPAFHAAIQHVGVGRAGAYGAILTEPLFDWIAAKAERGNDDQVSQVLDLLATIGLKDIRSLSVGATLDADDAMTDVRAAILSNGKKGVLSLFDVAPVAFAPPAFVGADAASVSMFQFDFAGLVPLVNQVIASMPAQEQQQMQQMAGMFLAMAEPILANVGPEVFVTSHYVRPFSATSQQQVWAIKLRDAQTASQALAGLFPMFGFQPREFQGNQIWSPGQGGMLPADGVSIGMGFGFVFVGPTVPVENAMRQAGGGGGARLVDEPAFKQAMRSLAGRGNMFGWTDTRKSVEWGQWMVHNMDKVVMQRLGENAADLDPDDRQAVIESALGPFAMFVKGMPNLEMISDHFGDNVFEMHSTADGFEVRMLTLRPAN